MLRFAADAGRNVEAVAGTGGVGSSRVVVESSAAGVIVMLGIIVKVNMVRYAGAGFGSRVDGACG